MYQLYVTTYYFSSTHGVGITSQILSFNDRGIADNIQMKLERLHANSDIKTKVTRLY